MDDELLRRTYGGYFLVQAISGIKEELNWRLDELNKAGCVELVMPVVQPAELWEETGRFEKMGEEMLRFKDRHGRDFVIQPTAEEVITDIARHEIRCHRQAEQ